MKFNHAQMREITDRFLDNPDPYGLEEPSEETLAEIMFVEEDEPDAPEEKRQENKDS